jgi:hypothetical protein
MTCAAVATSINEAGEILGFEKCGFPAASVPVVWVNGVAQSVSPPMPVTDPSTAWAGALSEDGDLLFRAGGRSRETLRFSREGSGTYRAHELHGFGYGGEAAFAQNDTDVVVGEARESDGTYHAAVFHPTGHATDIDPSVGSVAAGVDAAGHIAGTLSTQSGEQAFTYDGATVKPIPLSSGEVSSAALGKARSGLILGYEFDANKNARIVVWSDSGTLLDAFDCNHHANPYYIGGMDDLGDVVGFLNDRTFPQVAAFVHRLGSGRCAGLNRYLPSAWQYQAIPTAINDDGRVVGEWWTGSGPSIFDYHAFVMVPR